RGISGSAKGARGRAWQRPERSLWKRTGTGKSAAGNQGTRPVKTEGGETEPNVKTIR
ncbi:hypothetical protein SARC_17200, partial [Sphaeroforma arctica JP610]